GTISPLSTKEREEKIQGGCHYSEMLPLEYTPSSQYMEAYYDALKNNAKETAYSIGRLADKIIEENKNPVLVSLARAGTPVGILLKRYIKYKYNISVKHYTISIIRDKGIDHNAIKYILKNHSPKNILFVDGWIGKGAILKELKKELQQYPKISSKLAVVADPANVTTLCGTNKDILIPSSCLNSTVSGLISRTVLNTELIGENDFHGGVYYGELKNVDLSYDFIESIEKEFVINNPKEEKTTLPQGMEDVLKIGEDFNIDNINFIKPGIGETTRVLLRRVPWKVLISLQHKNDPSLNHILKLAQEKNVEVEYYPLKNYKTCGIIKKLADA
ncbi:MAG: cysteine protease StiP family protein, partial [Anaerotignaceae bacterium]